MLEFRPDFISLKSTIRREKSPKNPLKTFWMEVALLSEDRSEVALLLLSASLWDVCFRCLFVFICTESHTIVCCTVLSQTAGSKNSPCFSSLERTRSVSSDQQLCFYTKEWMVITMALTLGVLLKEASWMCPSSCFLLFTFHFGRNRFRVFCLCRTRDTRVCLNVLGPHDVEEAIFFT